MAGLYDKIRKKKKENLLKKYNELNNPSSMAEAVGKFKDVTGKDHGAYDAGAGAPPEAALEGGSAIESQAEANNQGKCVEGVWVGGPNNGEACTENDEVDPQVKASELAGTMEDVNPDMEAESEELGLLGKLFKKQKGGSGIGNALRGAGKTLKGAIGKAKEDEFNESVVGKKGADYIKKKKAYEEAGVKLLDSSPFHQGAATDEELTGDAALDDLEGTEGGEGTSKGTINVRGNVYNVETDYDDTREKVLPVGGECPKGMVLGEDGICTTPTQKDPNVPDMPDEDWIKLCEKNPCLEPCHKQYKQCKETPKDGKCADGSEPGPDGKCTQGSENVSAAVSQLMEETTTPGTVSHNMTFADQLQHNWGKNISENWQKKNEAKNLKNQKQEMTPNEQALYDQAAKELGDAGDLTKKRLFGGKSAKIAREQQIFNKMDQINEDNAFASYAADNNLDLTNLSEEDAKKARSEFLKTYRPDPADLHGGQVSIHQLTRLIDQNKIDIEDLHSGDYDKERWGNLGYEDLERIRDLTGNQNRPGTSQHTEEITTEQAVTGTGSMDIPDDVQAQLDAATSDAEIEQIMADFRKSQENANSGVNAGTHKIYSKPAYKAVSKSNKPSGFKLKRGRLNRPGY